MERLKNLDRIKFYAYLFLASAETFVLLYFSFLPSIVTTEPIFWFRPGDMEHLIAYLIYGLLLSGVFSRFSKSKWVTILDAVLIGCAVGVICETIQMFVPTRVADTTDATIDGIGVLIGSFLKTKFLNWISERVKTVFS